MRKRFLGNSGLEVSALGLGCMRMTFADKPIGDTTEMIAFLHEAADRGITFFLTNRKVLGIETAPMVNQVETHPFNQEVEARTIMEEYGIVYSHTTKITRASVYLLCEWKDPSGHTERCNVTAALLPASTDNAGSEKCCRAY